MTIKDVKGKIVKINKSISSQKVYAWIEERINNQSNNDNKNDISKMEEEKTPSNATK